MKKQIPGRKALFLFLLICIYWSVSAQEVSIDSTYTSDAEKPADLQATEEQLRLFPNPASDFVIAYYNTSQYNGFGILTLTDMQGAIQHKVGLTSMQNQHTFNISSLSNGIYLISLQVNGNIIESKRFVKTSH